MAKPLMTLNVDLNDDGTFNSDWSQYLISCSYKLGRRSSLDRFGARTAILILDNTDSRFSPRNTSSPYSPNVKRGKRLRLTGQVTVPNIGNVMRNPSAEIATTHYAGFLGPVLITRETAAARYGGWGIQCKENGAEPNYGVKQVRGSTPGGAQPWTGSVWVKGSGANIGKDITLAVNATGGTGGTEAVNVTVTLSSSWQRVVATLAVTVGDHTNIEIVLWRPSSITADELFYTDAWQLLTGASAQLYLDGDQPACSWDGTAHDSTSSRPGNPIQNVFTGEIRNIKPSRSKVIGRVEIEATGIAEPLLRQPISAGPFTRVRADMIIERLLDVAEGQMAGARFGITPSEVMLEGAMRHPADAYSATLNTAATYPKDTGAAGDDPTAYDALEGDNVLQMKLVTTGGDDRGWGHIVTSRVTVGKTYRVSCFFRTPDASASGRQVKLRIETEGVVTSTEVVVTISNTRWTYASLTHAIPSGATVVKLLGRTTGGGWQVDESFWTDGVHKSPGVSGNDYSFIGRSFVGTKWAGTLEYVDAFERPVGDVLDEVCRSVGGWYYEDGSGNLVFEDYSQRDASVVPTARAKFHDEGGGGIPYKILSIAEPAENEAGTVTVGSFGDVMSLPAPSDICAKQVWTLEPATRVFTANELRTYFADYVSEGPTDDPREGQSGLIARRASMRVVPRTDSAWTTDPDFGSIQTPYVLNYGRSGIVTLKDDGDADIVYVLQICARIQIRTTSEQAFLSSGSGTPILELEMPAQGYQTQAMQDFLTWAAARYTNIAPMFIDLQFGAEDEERQLWAFSDLIGLPARILHDSGPGAFELPDTLLFYCESVQFSYEAGKFPVVRLGFEEA